MRLKSEVRILRQSMESFDAKASAVREALASREAVEDETVAILREELASVCDALGEWPDYLARRRDEFHEGQHAWYLDCEERLRKLIHEEMDVHEFTYKNAVNKLRSMQISASHEESLYNLFVRLAVRGIAVVMPIVIYCASFPYRVGKKARELFV